MTPDDRSLRFLFGLQRSGIKAGLQNVSALLSTLGNPERSFPVVHVAGTNGKGSTSAMIAAALTAGGFRVGLYTSPHLVDFTERIRIDGVKITPRRVAGYTRILRTQILRTKATFFDATTAIAFRYFADRRVDVAVIETGLGGRLDSTNVVTPVLSVITSIGLEHREYLGNTLSRIAFEKAGIIKPGAPVVVGEIARPALGVILRRAAHLGSRVVRTSAASSARNVSYSPAGLTGDFTAAGKSFGGLHVAVSGGHQVHNARVALLALRTLEAEDPRYNLDEVAVRKGFASLRELAGLSGRLQLVSRDPVVLVDAAHNPDGIAALVRALRELYPGKFSIVFGVVSDKEYGPMIELLRPIARRFTCVRAASPRSRDPRELSKYCHDRLYPSRVAGPVAAGVRLACEESGGLDPILVTGSHFVVGEALRAMKVGV